MNIPIGANTPWGGGGDLPNVNDVIQGWFQAMQFSQVTKASVGFQVKETMGQVDFQGVMQPASAKRLILLPEGQRSWKWYTLHADPSLALDVDDVVTYLGTQYRVTEQTDWRQYGYIEYMLLEDYSGAGPQVVTP